MDFAPDGNSVISSAIRPMNMSLCYKYFSASFLIFIIYLDGVFLSLQMESNRMEFHKRVKQIHYIDCIGFIRFWLALNQIFCIGKKFAKTRVFHQI